MAVFPNYYQMAVQFTVNPPIAPEHQPQSKPAGGESEEEKTGQFETPGISKRRRGQALSNNNNNKNTVKNNG